MPAWQLDERLPTGEPPVLGSTLKSLVFSEDASSSTSSPRRPARVSINSGGNGGSPTTAGGGGSGSGGSTGFGGGGGGAGDSADHEGGLETASRPSGIFRKGESFCSEKLAQHTGRKTADEAEHIREAVFIDATAMKDRIRKEMLQPVYDVTQFYKTEGLSQAIARSGIFEKVTLSVIALNAIWIAIETDGNDAEVILDAAPPYQIAEQLFCLYFASEWVIRFASFRSKRDCLRDSWFVFDSILVLTMVLETWVMATILVLVGGGSNSSLGNASILRMARLLRLSRMARMARLFRLMPELLILLKGIAAATRSVFFTLVLLFFLIYVFAVAFVQLTAGEPEDSGIIELFGSVPSAMHTLLLDGTIMAEPGDVVSELKESSHSATVLIICFYLFILLAAFTILNMLIGVLCEVVSGVAIVEREKLTVNFIRTQMERILHKFEIDCGPDGKITKADFQKILEDPFTTRALEEVRVDVVGLIDNIDFIFQGEGDRDDDDDDEEQEEALNFQKLMEVLLDLRGSNMATVKDIVDLKKYITTANGKIKDEIRVASGRPLSRGSTLMLQKSMTFSDWPSSEEAAVQPSTSSSSASPPRHLRFSPFDEPPVPQLPQPEATLNAQRRDLYTQLLEARAKLHGFMARLPPSAVVAAAANGLELQPPPQRPQQLQLQLRGPSSHSQQQHQQQQQQQQQQFLHLQSPATSTAIRRPESRGSMGSSKEEASKASPFNLPGSCLESEPQEEPGVTEVEQVEQALLEHAPSLAATHLRDLVRTLTKSQEGIDSCLEALQSARDWIHLLPNIGLGDSFGPSHDVAGMVAAGSKGGRFSGRASWDFSDPIKAPPPATREDSAAMVAGAIAGAAAGAFAGAAAGARVAAEAAAAKLAAARLGQRDHEPVAELEAICRYLSDFVVSDTGNPATLFHLALKYNLDDFAEKASQQILERLRKSNATEWARIVYLDVLGQNAKAKALWEKMYVKLSQENLLKGVLEHLLLCGNQG